MTPPSVADAELVARWRSGDIDAGRTLLKRHERAVARIFRGKVGSHVDDLLQNTFLRCVQALPQIEQPERFRAFLLSIARTELLRYLERAAGPRGQVDPLSATIHDFALTHGRRIDVRRTRHALHRALSRLPVDQQLCLELFYFEDMTSRELAVVVGAPHATVRSRLRLARERLRALLAEEGQRGDIPDTDGGFAAWAKTIDAGHAEG